jgi:hypothetical protein
MAEHVLTAHQAVADAINSVACELSYIGHLSEVLVEHAAETGDMRAEAMAHAIRCVSERVEAELVRRAEAAEAAKGSEASHG